MASEEEHKGEELSSPEQAIVYHAILHEGETELERSSLALAWSGLAAGLMIGFSFLPVGFLHAHLPDAKWRILVTSLGYTIGFILIILGRQQLFTENTLTVVLPLMARRHRAKLGNVARVWAIVLVTNLLGALLFAFVLAKTEMVDAETWQSLKTAADEAHRGSFAVILLRAIIAGWLIAMLVWLIPVAETARVAVIVILTWLISVGHFVHIVAGSVEVGFLVFAGARTWPEFFLTFFLPALIGNVLGGVGLVAALNHAQMHAEHVDDDEEDSGGIVIA